MARRGRKPKLATVTLAGIGNRQTSPVLREVDNPLHNPAHFGEAWNPKTIHRLINMKESALVTLEQRKLIDAAQVKAGDRFRSIWESLGGSGAGSFDYSREPVDGGGPRSALSDRQIQAGIDLAECRRILGIGYDVMVKVAGEGCAVTEMTQSKNLQRAYIEMLKQGLTALAIHFGYQSRGNSHKTNGNSLPGYSTRNP
ncbi:hypothetical protein GOZ96_04830 [Agrobacterium vitis]|uniref:Uncharacterized protein n=1 Tax=Agrobacterium vitis TaxID=373 RepID=A0A7J4X5N0_AGRVI|nr:hypothetical protein [Agrobacterium vitis]KAA3527065.1 hypothetical protein DXT89_14115 [Agrobacterium vitis]MUZ95914.1 hypothetical protein [Agrobacterium vitis]